jgi:AcrR family transcriptional regulator
VLLGSARRIFARDGFEACRIEDIAAAAGHTRGAFYANFDTKEDLFFALLYEEAEKHARQIRAAVSCGKTVRERLAALREHYVQCLADQTWVMLVLEFKLFAVRHPKLRSQLAAAHHRIRVSMKLDDVEELIGLDDKKRTESTRAVLEGLFTGLFLQHAFDPERLSEQQAGHYLGALFDFLLLPAASKGRVGRTHADRENRMRFW